MPDEPLSQATSRRLRGILAEHRISGSAMADAIGLTQSAFSRRLVGVAPFSLDELAAIADVLDVQLGVLLGLEMQNGPRREDEGRELVRHQGLEPRTRWFAASQPHNEDLTAEVIELVTRRRVVEPLPGMASNHPGPASLTLVTA